MEVKFPYVDGSRTIAPGSVGISDGFGKIMIMAGICALAISLDAWDGQFAFFCWQNHDEQAFDFWGIEGSLLFPVATP